MFNNLPSGTENLLAGFLGLYLLILLCPIRLLRHSFSVSNLLAFVFIVLLYVVHLSYVAVTTFNINLQNSKCFSLVTENMSFYQSLNAFSFIP